MGSDFLQIDGSTGIGGGQILRTALSLSAVRRRPFRLHRIRADRDPPGLSAQHLAAVRATADLCDAEVAGDALRSTEVRFSPDAPPTAGEYEINVADHLQGDSAGSVTLLLQTLLLPLSFADGTSHLTLRGGTHVAWSPPAEYLSDVYLPMLQRTGVEAELELERWGFYPEGEGVLHAAVAGHGRNSELEPLELMERGDLYTIDAYSAVANLPDHIRQRQAVATRQHLEREGFPVRLDELDPPSTGPGTAVYLCARYADASAGFVSYGRIGTPAEKIAEEAVEAFLTYHRADEPVQAHLADQLLLPLSLADGPSEYRTAEVTGHLRTNAQVVKPFVDRSIEIQGARGTAGTVRID